MLDSQKSLLRNLYKSAFGLPLMLAACFFINPLQVQSLQAQAVKKEVKLTPKQLKAFEGKYQFQFEPGKDAFIQITAKDNQLVLKESWTGNEIPFSPVSELEFFNQEKSFPLKFTKDKNGAITQVLAFNRDLWNRVKE